MSRWVNYVDPQGRDRLVTRNQASSLIASGAEPCGEKNGYPCIAAKKQALVWRKITPRTPSGEKLGYAGMELVRL